MTVFNFEPFVGPLPLRFGMTPKEVETLVGRPDSVASDPFGNPTESRLGYWLGYDANSGELVEAVFSKGELRFHGVNLLDAGNVIDVLRKYDASPQQSVGMIFFVGLGIRVSGVSDDDGNQFAVGLTKKGHWEEFLDDFVPFD